MKLNTGQAKPLLLIFPFNQLSHYLRCLMLAKKLKPYYDILFANSAAYDSFVIQEGFGSFSCRSIDSDKVLEAVKQFSFSWINEKSLALIYEDQVRIIEQYHPALVLGDAIPTLKMATEKTGVTYISLINGYMSYYYAVVRQLPRAFPGYSFFKVLPGSLLHFLITIGEPIAFYAIHQPFKKLRRQYALSIQEQYLDETEGDINLICDLPEIFPQKKLPGHYIFIPPLFYKAGAPPSGIVEKLDKSKKTIFVSMGSTGNWSRACFLNHLYFQKYNIVTAGDSENLLNASFIIKEKFVNVDELFPHTDLVICHGGNGTICQALSYGIPLLCVPVHFEQEWNVQRLEDLDLGKSLNDVNSLETYFNITDEWAERKGLPVYNAYREKISDAMKAFDKIIELILSKINDLMPVHS